MSGTRSATPAAAKAKLKQAFRQHLGLGAASARQLLRGALIYDKAYELSCLLETIAHLKSHRPARTFTLIGGSSVTFRTKGGPIQRGSWPFVAVSENGRTVAELWVDIEFQALSAHLSSIPVGHPSYGAAHELDIVLVDPWVSGYPTPYQILLGVESKHRPYTKALLKELLGVRREMTFRSSGLARNEFVWWNGGEVPANPPSALIAYASGSNIALYDGPADFFGIRMIHHDW